MTTPSYPEQVSPMGLISVMFTPEFEVDGSLPDLVILAADSVAFHVHSATLLSASDNGFGGMIIQRTRFLCLTQSSFVLNIALHIMYGMSCVPYQPPLESTESALDALIQFGVSVARLATSQPLFLLMLSYAPHHPIETYAIAAHYGLENIAVATSSHLLAFDFTTLSDALAIKMGPVYFRRLFHLQRARFEALRNIVLQPPEKHPLVPGCDEELQKEVQRAWAFGTASLVWSALPNTSTGALHSVFTQAGAEIVCPECKGVLNQRIQDVLHEWSAVKRTI